MDAPENDVQPREHAENRAVNDGQQPINEDLVIPPDVEPMPVDVDHWVRRSTRVRRLIQRFDPSLQYVMLSDEGEPLTYKEAKLCEHKKKWELAMEEEIKALHANDTWDLVDLPKDWKAISNKWVFKSKLLMVNPSIKPS